jgi:hypothetical protein
MITEAEHIMSADSINVAVCYIAPRFRFSKLLNMSYDGTLRLFFSFSFIALLFSYSSIFAQDWVKGLVLANMVMEICVPYKSGNY